MKTIPIDPQLHKRLKLYATEKEVPIKTVIEELITFFLDKEENKRD